MGAATENEGDENAVQLLGADVVDQLLS